MRPFAKAAISANTIAPAPAGGPDVYYYSATWDAGASTVNSYTYNAFAPQSFAYGQVLTISEAGTATTISVYGRSNSGTVTMKLALYDSNFDLVANGSVSVSGGAAWRNVAINVTVSSGTHYIFMSSSNDNGEYGFDNTTTGLYISSPLSQPHASFPPSSFSSTAPESAGNFGVRVYVD